MAFLDLDGLKTFKNCCDNRYAYKSHTHTLSQVSDWGTYIYSATVARSAGTVLSAPLTSDGVARFRKLNSNNFADKCNIKGRVDTATNWDTPLATGWYQVASASTFTGTNAPSNVYTYGYLYVLISDQNIATQIYISHTGDVLMRQAWDWSNNLPNYGAWHRIATDKSSSISKELISSLF